MKKVYLTGAGPGDIELLTLKALKVIQKADVIVYDRLANPDILKYTQKSCVFIYVGKEDKKHILPQDEINQVLYDCSQKYELVVRLKGGDPFVFGRGGEEALFLKEKNIAYEIIPGITSAISVPAYAGIPVTHRGVSVSFRVVTAHESPLKEQTQIPWKEFISDDTLVFLMGLSKLEQISTKLIEIGKDKTLPVAVISKGTTPEQKVVVGTLETISKLAKNLESPALIVVGEVVSLREELAWFEEGF